MSDEYLLAGFSLQEVRGIFQSFIDMGIGHTLFSADGRPIAVMIWQDDPGGGVATSFAATEDFFASTYLRPFRRYMDDFQALRHNARIVSYSHSTHPDVPGWFRFLKFECIREEGVHRDFVRAPRG